MERMRRAIWRRTMRGGHGDIEDAPALIVRRTPKRVRVLVVTRAGAIVERSVSPERLREPTVDDLRAHRAVWRRLDPKPTPPPLHPGCRCAMEVRS